MAIEVPMRFESEPLLWLVDDIYTPSECKDLIKYIEKSSPSLATNNPMYRDQDRVIRDDRTLSRELFRRLQPHLAEKMGNLSLVGINERFRMYRYRVGQRFAPHMDHWYRPNHDRITLHSVLVYLNGNFDGGETRFLEQLDEIVVPKTGMAAIFQHKIRHEGCSK